MSDIVELLRRVKADIEASIGRAERELTGDVRDAVLSSLDNDLAPIAGALDEIERLRAWKAEAIEVLARWEEVAELVPMQLGDVKSQAVKDWVQKMQAAAIEEALSKWRRQ